MAIDCDSPGCTNSLPYNHVISTSFTDFTRIISADCSRNYVVFTDDPGLVDVSVPLSGAYLTAENRYKYVTSYSQVVTNYTTCSGTARDLNVFFANPVRAGSRPAGVILAFVDTDNGETLADAAAALQECFDCFIGYTHVSVLKDGASTWADTADQLALAAWGQQEEKIGFFSSHDEATLITAFSETGSIPAQAAALGYNNAVWTLDSQGCRPELDANCDPVDPANTESYWQPTYLMAGAVATSYSAEAATYSWTLKFRPGCVGLVGVNTINLTQSEVINVTGTFGPSGGQQADAARFVNVYANIANVSKGFIEGMTVTGFFVDDLFKRAWMVAQLRKNIVQILCENSCIGLSDTSLSRVFDARLAALIQGFVGQRIISNDPDVIKADTFDNVRASGNGWILVRPSVQDQTSAATAQRFIPEYTFCYIGLRCAHFVTLNLCDAIKPEQITNFVNGG